MADSGVELLDALAKAFHSPCSGQCHQTVMVSLVSVRWCVQMGRRVHLSPSRVGVPVTVVRGWSSNVGRVRRNW